MAHIAIIGAGAAGLSAAWELSLQGHTATLFESEGQVGGLAAGFQDESWEWTLEKFYHHWFQSDADLLQLADELGVRHKILFPRPKTSLWAKGNFIQIDGAVSALTTPFLTWPEKIRFGLVMLYLRLGKNWRWMEKYTADEWLRRYFGDALYEKMWRPLLIGKFGEFYQEANMAWMWARLHSRTTRLGTYEGGFQRFLQDLAEALTRKGVKFHFNTPVQCIEKQADGKIKVEAANESQVFDAVISTTSPRLLLKLVPTLQGSYAQKVSQLRSMGAVVVILALKQQVMTNGTYWLSLPAETPDKTQNEFPILAIVEHTNYMDKAHFGNDHLVYLGDYVLPDHRYFHMNDDGLMQLFTASLQKVNPQFSSDWIRRWWVFRAPYAQPLPTVNHSQNIPDLRTPIQGIYWASMSQVYPWDRGTNYAVEIGRRVARLAVEDLK